MAVSASPGGAQLRPLEPIPWDVFQKNAVIAADLSWSTLLDQRASLAGTSGTLTELGNFSLSVRTGRVALQGTGTAERVFRDRSRFAEPYSGVEVPTNNRRHDAGDYAISTSIRVTPDEYPLTGVLRFGTRLPTTTDNPGLDRNATDFFATLGASGERAAFFARAEGGLSVNGTRAPVQQQTLFVYGVHAGARAGMWSPRITFLGQLHERGQVPIRGLESLGEARLGLRYSRQVWLQVEAVKGYETFSPSRGIVISAGYIH